ncbi:hypothetical protein M422DRAFT_149726 [Sphaerobolus stellatus SS14]|nr:hypothetical protein M422DRAFT_149726 [Sphaerobolus stellatus SS14]
MAEKDISTRLRRARTLENNFFIVKRLLERTNDMRNADPVGPRYTSLAWAAVLGNEETFEYLLERGHDDDELSKDAENNTILILLAGLPSDSVQEAALRMGRLYLERYPFVLDWSNAQGKTALHMAALKGNEDFVGMLCDFSADVDLADLLGNTPLHYASSWGHLLVVKLLIERGCQFAARNNEGYTATDYAYSYVVIILFTYSTSLYLFLTGIILRKLLKIQLGLYMTLVKMPADRHTYKCAQ